jgi:hypothetical protein
VHRAFSKSERATPKTQKNGKSGPMPDGRSQKNEKNEQKMSKNLQKNEQNFTNQKNGNPK